MWGCKMSKKAFINGKIYTADEKNLWAEAIIINKSTIEYVGSNIDVMELFSDVDTVIDLNGKLVVPGFIDSHAHIIMGGFYLLSVDLTKVVSVDEFITKLKDYTTSNPGKMIVGGNWNHQNWDIKEMPNKKMIDEFTQDIPVFIHRMDYHSALANSYALKLAEITKDTPNPDGGTIVKDPITGEPTGMLKDKAMDLVANKLPERSEEEYEKACLTALEEAKRLGVTSIHDIAYKNDFRTFQKLLKKNKITTRIYTRLPIEKCYDLINTEIENPFGNELLKIGSLKAFADGSLGSYTALFFEPYIDDKESFGLAMDTLSNGKIREWALAGDKANLQLSIHAIGDKANSMILDIAEELENTNGNKDRRFRIEHAQHLHPKDIKRFKDLKIVASMQPYHLYDDGCWAVTKIGEDRLKLTYAFKTLINEGVKVCFGSDWPVVTMDPILGIYTAVTRHTMDGKNPNGLVPEEKLTVKEAVDCYTINAAYASYEEDLKGSITKGKFADFVVLSEDIFTIEPAKIKDVKVSKTIFNGEIIYSA